MIYQLVYCSGITETVKEDWEYCIDKVVDLPEECLKEVNIFKDKVLVSQITRKSYETYDEFDDTIFFQLHVWKY